jgi:hypothetical protein
VKSMSASLQAAQRSLSSQPFVEALVTDFAGDRSRLRLERHWNEAGELTAGTFHALAATSDGTLLRALLTSGGALDVKRVTSPGSSSTWGSPYVFSTTGVSGSRGIAMCALGTKVLLFYVTSNTVLNVWVSNNDGVSWSGPTTVTSGGGNIGFVAAAFASDGDALVVWNESATVYRSRYDGSTWGARTAWTNTVASVTGLAVTYLLDWQVVVTGTQPTTLDPKVWGCIYGDDVNITIDTWTTLREIMSSSSGSAVSFRVPCITRLGAWRLWFVEWFTSTTSYQRLSYSTMDPADYLTDELWQEPLPVDFEDFFGAAVAVIGSRLWLSARGAVWSSLAPASSQLNLTARVLEATVEIGAGGGRARVVLDNEDGELTGYGAGDLVALQRGGRLQLTPGYQTTVAQERPGRFAYWIDRLELLTGAEPRLVLHAHDGQELLERWRARRSYVWAAGTRNIFQLVAYVCARAGLDYTTSSSSSSLTDLQPAFTIHPGETGASAVRRLLAMVEDRALWKDGVLTNIRPQASDAAVYTLGNGGHVVTGGRYVDGGRAANRAQVTGTSVFAEAFDFGDIVAVGDRIVQAVDLNLTTGGTAAARAAAILRETLQASRGDVVDLFGVATGLELFDVVELSDDQAGLEEELRRVLGVSWAYVQREARYDMRLTLGLR